MADDAATGYDSLDAILAAKATSTIMKHVGPLRVFCEWLTKSGAVPPFAEKVVWSKQVTQEFYGSCRRRWLDTSLRALKWSYHALGLKIELTVFQSPRICGLATKALQGKCPWDPAAALTVAEVLQLHSIASDRTVSVIDRCGAAHFLGLLYGRARASDVRSVRPTDCR
eukprot:s9547_g4.t1